MPPSDNESSDDETQDFTTTNVLLGYASKESTDDSFSQLGGYPVRLHPTKMVKKDLRSQRIYRDGSSRRILHLRTWQDAKSATE